MRLLPSAGEIISSPKAKIPGLAGASSTLKLDSQRNHLHHSRRKGSKRDSIPYRACNSLTICDRFSIPTALLATCSKAAFPGVKLSQDNGHRRLMFEEPRRVTSGQKRVVPVFLLLRAVSGREYCLWDSNSTAVCCTCQQII